VAQLARLARVHGRTVGSFALAVWFAYWGWKSIADTFTEWPNHLDTVGIDGRLYYRAAVTWLSGGNPWTAFTTTNTWPVTGQYIHFFFTGPPPTVLAFVPFAWIPETLFVVGWFALTIAAAVYVLRRLHLPIWWLMFPPLVEGILVANPHVVCLALLLSSSTWLRALAAPLKAYAVIPMVGDRQWRALGLLALGVGLSVVVFWPLWTQYRADYAHISDWLAGATYGGWSAARDPRLFAITAGALGTLALIDFWAAGWLAVPALWPAAQYFYASFVLPLRSPLLAAVVATGLNRADAVVPWAIVAYAVARVGAWLWHRRDAGTRRDLAGASGASGAAPAV
jgi:hypothetical protein